MKEEALQENAKDSLIGKLSSALNMMAGFSMLGVAVITVYEVVLRKIFSMPTGWVFTTSLFVMMWFALLAASQGLRERRHISVDIVLMWFSQKTKAYLEIASCICSLFFVSIITYFGSDMCVDAYKKGMTSIDMLIYPLWILYLVFPLCGVVMILQILELFAHRRASLRCIWLTNIY